MKHLQLSGVAIASLLILPAAVKAADDLSYSYIEADYVVKDIDLFEDDEVFDNILEDIDDGDGYKIGGSLGLGEHVFLFGNFSNTEADFTFIDDTDLLILQGQDVKELNVGLGLALPMSDMTDFVVRGTYVDIDYGDFSLGADEDEINNIEDFENAFDDLNDDNSDGYAVDAGVRSQIIDWLEIGGGVRYTKLDSGDDVSAFGNVLFEISQNFGINAGAHFGDNVSSYELGVRFSM